MAVNGARRRTITAAAMMGLQGYFAFDAMATSTWTNASGGNWSTSSNWSAGVPTDTAYFGPANDSYTVSFSGSTSVGILNVQASSSPILNLSTNTLSTGLVNIAGPIGSSIASGTLSMTSGMLTTSTMWVGGTSGSELYDLQSGALSAGVIYVGENGLLQVGNLNNYNAAFSAGTVTVEDGGELDIATGSYAGSLNESINTLNIETGGSVAGEVFCNGSFSDSVSGTTSSLSLYMQGSATGTPANWQLQSLEWDSSSELSIGFNQGVETQSETVGVSQISTVSQSSGGNSTAVFNLGFGPHGTGIYNLSGGNFTVSNEELIGAYGSGTFVQSGSINSLEGENKEVYVGYAAGGSGLYSLSGGTFGAWGLYVGYSGTSGTTTGAIGTFSQSGGVAGAGQFLELGYGAGAVGTYLLSNGVLGAGAENIGGAGSGTFVQSGGTNTLFIGLVIGVHGAYTLSSGSLNLESISVQGDMTISGGTLTPSQLAISGGNVTFSREVAPATFFALSIQSGGKLDLTDNHIFVTYSSSDPISTIIGYIRSGYNNGEWNGSGIISSTARSPANGLDYGLGWADGKDKIVAGLLSGQIEIKYTLLGDANLDGVVNGSDFSILAANFGQGVTNWDQGNFLFTPAVNGSDFSALATNFGQGDSGAAASVSAADIAALDSFAVANGLPLPVIRAVPEPGAISLIAVGTGLLVRRRGARD